jgi:hypothetical protein
MTNQRLALFVCVIAAAAACKTKHEVADIGSSGYVLDVPSGGKVATEMDRFYSVKDGNDRTVVQVVDSQSSGGSVDDEVKSRCAGRSEINKGTIGSNGYWYSCKGASNVIKGSKIVTTLIGAVVPHDDGKGAFECNQETDKDPEPALTACKSIRKKG